RGNYNFAIAQSFYPLSPLPVPAATREPLSPVGGIDERSHARGPPSAIRPPADGGQVVNLLRPVRHLGRSSRSMSENVLARSAPLDLSAQDEIASALSPEHRSRFGHRLMPISLRSAPMESSILILG